MDNFTIVITRAFEGNFEIVFRDAGSPDGREFGYCDFLLFLLENGTLRGIFGHRIRRCLRLG
jgi:hypothetical protein